jgi:predicted nucleotidyltransferase
MINFDAQPVINILGYFFLNPEKKIYGRELATNLKVDPGNLSRQLKALEKDGLLLFEILGRQRYYSLNKSHPLLKEIKKIYEAEHSVSLLLKKRLVGLPKLKEAYIFGSYAQNKLNQESDIDILLIGDHSGLDARRALLPLKSSLGRDINIVDFSSSEYNKKKKEKNEFLQNVFKGEVIKII